MKNTLIALALAALLPVSAQASDISYTYAGLEYTTYTGGDESGDAWNVYGSYNFGESGFFMTASYLDGDMPHGGHTDAMKNWSAGLGFHHAISDKTDLVYEYTNQFRFDGDDSGTPSGGKQTVWFGARHVVNDNWQTTSRIGYVDFRDDDSGVVVNFGAQYKLGEVWSLTMDIEAGHDCGNSYDTGLSVGMRASW